MKTLICIDPGASGGIAVMDNHGAVAIHPMPEGMTAQLDMLRAVACCPRITAVMEKTGTYVPGNSGVAAATFARHCGHLEAALYAFGVPCVQVAPAKWMKHLGALPKEKPERKRAIRELMQARYPHLSVTLKTADALGILTWAMAQP